MAGTCSPGCYTSRDSRSRCECRCGGASHGQGSQPIPAASPEGILAAAPGRQVVARRASELAQVTGGAVYAEGAHIEATDGTGAWDVAPDGTVTESETRLLSGEPASSPVEVDIRRGIPSLTVVGAPDRVNSEVAEILRGRGRMPVGQRVTVNCPGSRLASSEQIADAVETAAQARFETIDASRMTAREKLDAYRQMHGRDPSPRQAARLQDDETPPVRAGSRDLTDVIARHREQGAPGLPVHCDQAAGAIKSALRRRSGKQWSVTRGRGTASGWITIKAPRSRLTGRLVPRDPANGGKGAWDVDHVDCGEHTGYMTPADCEELGNLLGLGGPADHQGVSVADDTSYYIEYVARAEGRAPSEYGSPYWD